MPGESYMPGDSGCLCCWTCVMYFEHQLTPLWDDSAQALWASFQTCYKMSYSNYAVENLMYLSTVADKQVKKTYFFLKPNRLQPCKSDHQATHLLTPKPSVFANLLQSLLHWLAQHSKNPPWCTGPRKTEMIPLPLVVFSLSITE